MIDLVCIQFNGKGIMFWQDQGLMYCSVMPDITELLINWLRHNEECLFEAIG
jgi:hypothetical protein